ncbi:hypothetical protein [Rhodococcus ruber]
MSHASSHRVTGSGAADLTDEDLEMVCRVLTGTSPTAGDRAVLRTAVDPPGSR